MIHLSLGWLALLPTVGAFYDLYDSIPDDEFPRDRFWRRQTSEGLATSYYKVLVGYRNQETEDMLIDYSISEGRKVYNFTTIPTVAMELTADELEELYHDPSIAYLEPESSDWSLDSLDPVVPQTVPYGIRQIQGLRSLRIPKKIRNGGCSNNAVMRVGIVDSGIDGSHPDLRCTGPGSDYCLGQSFGVTDAWYADRQSHGTHVAGTVAAMDNDEGVLGVISDNSLCLLVARVIGDSTRSVHSLEAFVAAVEWLVAQNAKVINISIGGSSVSHTLRLTVEAAEQSGKLIVASAGNTYDESLQYPAAYSSVISVAAIDSTKTRATFSTMNKQVDLAAPGVQVLSTVPSGSGYVRLTVGSKSWVGRLMGQSVYPASSLLAAQLVECTNLGRDICEGPGGHICLIKRGDTTFEAKALNCEASGGVAALIYNNVKGFIDATLADPTAVTIPVLELSLEQGLLAQERLNTTVELFYVDGYSLYSGTSMSAPHVTGAIATVWRACPLCNHEQVRDCFFATAKDLGEPGHDIEYGHGMVRMRKAHNCLRKVCCGRQRASSGNRHASHWQRREGRRQNPHRDSLTASIGQTLMESDGPTWPDMAGGRVPKVEL